MKRSLMLLGLLCLAVPVFAVEETPSPIDFDAVLAAPSEAVAPVVDAEGDLVDFFDTVKLQACGTCNQARAECRAFCQADGCFMGYFACQNSSPCDYACECACL